MNMTQGEYVFVMMNCDLVKISHVYLNYTFLNPDGEELSAGDELKPWSYLIILLFWIILLGLMFAFYFFFI